MRVLPFIHITSENHLQLPLLYSLKQIMLPNKIQSRTSLNARSVFETLTKFPLYHPTLISVLLVICRFRFLLVLLAACTINHEELRGDDPNVSLMVSMKAHRGGVESIAFNPNGTSFCSGGRDGQLVWWNFGAIQRDCQRGIPPNPNVANWEMDRVGLGDRVLALDFDPQGNALAASGATHWGNGFGASAKLFTKIRKEPYGLGSASATWSYSCLSLSRDGNFVAMGALNSELKLVRLGSKLGAKGGIVKDFINFTAPGIPSEVYAVDFHPTKPLLAVGGKGGWIRFYRIDDRGLTFNPLAQEASHSASVRSLSFTANGKLLVSAGDDGKICVFDTLTGATLNTWAPVDAKPRELALHPKDNPWALVGYNDNSSILLNFESGQILSKQTDHTESVEAVAFSLDGNFAATGGLDHAINLYDLGIKPAARKRRK